MSNLLEVADLTVRAGHRVLVEQVSFSVAPGARVGIIGASGSGKTLTCLAISGLLDPSLRASGHVQLAGVPGNLLEATERQLARLRGLRIGMVFQEPMTALDPTMTVGRQIAEVLLIHRQADRRRAADLAVELLEAADLPDPARLASRYPHQLSGGQRQRVVLAIALANAPDLLICDEPTTALDVTVQAKMLDWIDLGARQADSAVLFISHDLAVVAGICDEVHVMFGGRIVESGPVVEVLEHPRHEHTQRLLADSSRGLT